MQRNHAKDQKDQLEDETLDFTKPDYQFIPKENHDWRQQGPYLVCKSCEIQHGTYIEMDKILTGFDKKNQPIIKRR